MGYKTDPKKDVSLAMAVLAFGICGLWLISMFIKAAGV